MSHRVMVTTNKDVFTTGDIARIVGICARTVGKLFDSGKLKGYRIPGSKDRRVTRKQLEEFLAENGLPFFLGGGVLVVGHARPLHGWPDGVLYAPDSFTAGKLLADRTPELIVIDAAPLGRQEAVMVARRAKADVRLARVRIMIVLAEDDAETRVDGCEMLRGGDGMAKARSRSARLMEDVS